MLSYQDKRSIVRTLTYRYFSCRNLSLLRVCKRYELEFAQHDEDLFAGYAYGSHRIEVPRGATFDYKERVFWHEFCHTALSRLHIFEGTRIGLQEQYRMLDPTSDYWVLERICEAFANAMFLYRRGLSRHPTPNMEAFLFADTSSVGYAELARFSMSVIREHVVAAEAAKTNIDLRSVKELLASEEHCTYLNEFQQMLPTDFPDTHQIRHIRYVDEEKDWETQQEPHWGKASWGHTEILPPADAD